MRIDWWVVGGIAVTVTVCMLGWWAVFVLVRLAFIH